MAKRFDRIYIELSNNCNFNCPFCSSVRRAPRAMTVSEVSAILSQVVQFTDEVCLHVLGEPLIYENLEQVFNICSEHGLKINLVTNGYYINKNLTLLMKYSYLFKKISFSVHSYVYLQDNIFDKLSDIMKASMQLAEQGVSIEIRNLADNNESDFTQCLIDAINSVCSVRLIDIHCNQKIKEQLYYVVKKPFVWPDKSIGGVKRENAKGRIYCLGGKTHIAILSNLDVAPCCLDTAGEIALGNLHDSSLVDILSSESFKILCQTLKDGKPAHKLCETCSYCQRK